VRRGGAPAPSALCAASNATARAAARRMSTPDELSVPRQNGGTRRERAPWLRKRQEQASGGSGAGAFSFRCCARDGTVGVIVHRTAQQQSALAPVPLFSGFQT
jgi:hypothetical protein